MYFENKVVLSFIKHIIIILIFQPIVFIPITSKVYKQDHYNNLILSLGHRILLFVFIYCNKIIELPL